LKYSKKMQELIPAATTSYPCLLSHLGGLEGADHTSPAGANVQTFLEIKSEKNIVRKKSLDHPRLRV